MRITLLAATLAAARRGRPPSGLLVAPPRRRRRGPRRAASSHQDEPKSSASLNEREHAAECVKVEGEAWSGDLEPDTEILPRTSSPIPDWYLPDLDAELRNNGDVEIHVTKTPLFSQRGVPARDCDGRRTKNNAERGGNPRGAVRISASRRVETPSRHRRDSCPSDEVDFGPRRACTTRRAGRRPRRLGERYQRCQESGSTACYGRGCTLA